MKLNRRGLFGLLGGALLGKKVKPKTPKRNLFSPYSDFIAIHGTPYKNGDLYAEILGMNAGRKIDLITRRAIDGTT